MSVKDIFWRLCPFALAGAILLAVVSLCMGHGRLLEPPSRAVLWERKFHLSAYDDEYQGFCGGIDARWNRFGGLCGVCGDPYSPLPRAHERGGRHYIGTPTRAYTSGHVINVTLGITANHKGWLEFRLCSYDDPMPEDVEHDSSGKFVEVTQQCLNKHLLALEDGTTRYYLPASFSVGERTVRVRLPDKLTCKNCLLQWKWNMGNSWGIQDGVPCLGCGDDEQFYACADVVISELPIRKGLPNIYESTVEEHTGSSLNGNGSSKIITESDDILLSRQRRGTFEDFISDEKNTNYTNEKNGSVKSGAYTTESGDSNKGKNSKVINGDYTGAKDKSGKGGAHLHKNCVKKRDDYDSISKAEGKYVDGKVVQTSKNTDGKKSKGGETSSKGVEGVNAKGGKGANKGDDVDKDETYYWGDEGDNYDVNYGLNDASAEGKAGKRAKGSFGGSKGEGTKKYSETADDKYGGEKIKGTGKSCHVPLIEIGKGKSQEVRDCVDGYDNSRGQDGVKSTFGSTGGKSGNGQDGGKGKENGGRDEFKSLTEFINVKGHDSKEKISTNDYHVSSVAFPGDDKSRSGIGKANSGSDNAKSGNDKAKTGSDVNDKSNAGGVKGTKGKGDDYEVDNLHSEATGGSQYTTEKGKSNFNNGGKGGSKDYVDVGGKDYADAGGEDKKDKNKISGGKHKFSDKGKGKHVEDEDYEAGTAASKDYFEDGGKGKNGGGKGHFWYSDKGKTGTGKGKVFGGKDYHDDGDKGKAAGGEDYDVFDGKGKNTGGEDYGDGKGKNAADKNVKIGAGKNSGVKDYDDYGGKGKNVGGKDKNVGGNDYEEFGGKGKNGVGKNVKVDAGKNSGVEDYDDYGGKGKNAGGKDKHFDGNDYEEFGGKGKNAGGKNVKIGAGKNSGVEDYDDYGGKGKNAGGKDKNLGGHDYEEYGGKGKNGAGKNVKIGAGKNSGVEDYDDYGGKGKNAGGKDKHFGGNDYEEFGGKGKNAGGKDKKLGGNDYEEFGGKGKNAGGKGKNVGGKDYEEFGGKGKNIGGKDYDGFDSEGKISGDNDYFGFEGKGKNGGGKDYEGFEVKGKKSGGKDVVGFEGKGKKSGGKDVDGFEGKGKKSGGKETVGFEGKGKNGWGKDYDYSVEKDKGSHDYSDIVKGSHTGGKKHSPGKNDGTDLDEYDGRGHEGDYDSNLVGGVGSGASFIAFKNIKRCRGAGKWEKMNGMEKWCFSNCKNGYCPETHCKCI